VVKIKKSKKHFKNVSGDILDVRMRDWYGHTFFRQKVNTADKGRMKLCLKTIADFSNVNLKESLAKEKLEAKEKFKKKLQEEKDRVKKLLNKEEYK
jgi:hypothetical protein